MVRAQMVNLFRCFWPLNRLFCLYSCLSVAGIANAQISMESFAKRLHQDYRHRFEAVDSFICPSGSTPSLDRWNQYYHGENNDLTFGRAKNLAPYIWIGKDFFDKPIISLSSAVWVDWVDCDDDGNTTERTSGSSFRSIYDLAGDISSPVISRRHYVQNGRSQQLETAYPYAGSAMFASLNDYDPFASGEINGPADEPVILDSPEILNVSFELVGPSVAADALNQFILVFKDACGAGEDLKLTYARSNCGGMDGPMCDEVPKAPY